MIHPLRWIRRVVGAVLAVTVGYVAVTFVQVWMASRRDDARPAQAIIVLAVYTLVFSGIAYWLFERRDVAGATGGG